MIDISHGLCKEDIEEINLLKEQIKKNVINLELPLAIAPTYSTRIGKDSLRIQQQDGGKYYFYSEAEVLEGLHEFFSNDYLQEVLARKSYIYDEDEEFTEILPVENELGLAKVGRVYKKSNLLKVLFKVLPFGKPDPVTGMPVHVESVMLVAE